MDGKSLDIIQEQEQKLKELFPEAFSEDEIDWEKLQATLGKDITFSNERYVLNWAGKSDAFRVLQSPTTATLIPNTEESINFNDTENVFIEGENLEVLKTLQRSYHNKVKLIYIDPPYNTGKEHFIYPDKFSETKEEYLKRIGDKNEEGYLTSEGFLRKNSRDNGHYHSNWLSMMYPRLFLAKTLLKEDGVIFVSIDDHEVYNLRILMNEIFGEENFIAQLIWDRGHSAQAGIFKVYHEYVLCYAKSVTKVITPRQDNKELFEAGAMKRESRRHPMQDFRFPKGTRFDAPDGKEFRDSWGETEKVILKDGKMICKNGKLAEDVTLRAAWTQMNQMKAFFEKEKNIVDSRGQRVVEFYFTSSGKLKIVKERGVFTPPTTLKKYGSTGPISVALAKMFDMDESPINNPKNPDMIKDFVEWFTLPESNHIVLDFFAGACPTAEAVLQLNKESNGNRKFIMVQIAEPTPDNSAAYRNGYKTISEIGKNRLCRVIKTIEGEKTEKPELFPPENGDIDLGFKFFKLQPSNFKTWRSQLNNSEELLKQVDAFEDPIKPETKEENMVYELILKSGRPLTSKIEKKSYDKINYYVINDSDLIFVLSGIDQAVIKEIIKQKPGKVIALDKLFKGNDQLKTNTVLQMKDAGIDFKTI